MFTPEDSPEVIGLYFFNVKKDTRITLTMKDLPNRAHNVHNRKGMKTQSTSEKELVT